MLVLEPPYVHGVLERVRRRATLLGQGTTDPEDRVGEEGRLARCTRERFPWSSVDSLDVREGATRATKERLQSHGSRVLPRAVASAHAL